LKFQGSLVAILLEEILVKVNVRLSGKLMLVAVGRQVAADLNLNFRERPGMANLWPFLLDNDEINIKSPLVKRKIGI
jgi:hypothetical protein